MEAADRQAICGHVLGTHTVGRQSAEMQAADRQAVTRQCVDHKLYEFRPVVLNISCMEAHFTRKAIFSYLVAKVENVPLNKCFIQVI